jgi:16S rRNA G1207 methylase RsmC
MPVMKPARCRALLLAGTLMLVACGRGPLIESPTARAADREAVEAALARYTHGLDRLDDRLYTSSFAPDGVLVIAGTSRQGHDALRKVIADEAALRQASKARGESPRTLFHLESNSRITFPEPDRAEHEAYWITISRTTDTPDGMQVLGVGTSTDELRRIDGHWLITRREIILQP